MINNIDVTHNLEITQLKNENAELKEKLKNYIPRRRIRRVYKELRSILEEDLIDENTKHLDTLKAFATKIEKEGPQVAGDDVRQAIEHILGSYEQPTLFNSVPYCNNDIPVANNLVDAITNAVQRKIINN